MSVPLEQLVYQGLLATPAFIDLLGVDAGGNVAFYDRQLPQQSLNAAGGSLVLNVSPAGVYQRISSPRIFAQGAGALQGNTGRARFRFTFWSNAKNATVVLNQIDLAVRGFFQGFVGVGSPAITNPSFFAYESSTGIEPQTQPPMPKLTIDMQFWFNDQ